MGSMVLSDFGVKGAKKLKKVKLTAAALRKF
jgi:hypothetical protein